MKPITHIAIIMDGNGRWAEARGRPRAEGHRAGAETARRITRAARRLSLPALTLYALSTENLDRPREELAALSALMRHYLDHEVPSLIEHSIRLRVIGNRKLLSADLRRRIASAEKATAGGTAMTLALALAYGGRDEIVRAASALAEKGGPLTAARLETALDTKGLPDPDLLIRTGGELRLSNFLLWQSAYTELFFTRTLWPDFTGVKLRAAIAEYHRRERRFGRAGEEVARPSAKLKKPRGKFK
jgi:undecaprenyl diphosphate synthase